MLSHGYRLKRVGGRKGKLRPAHQVIWEEANGPLRRGWMIHHKNEIRDDNRLENLEAMTRAKHNRLHGRNNVKRR